MQNRVFVLNKHQQPLMPCSPRTARKLLEQGKATVAKKEPFTIQLKYGSTGYKQPVSLGIDSGQRHIGIAVTSNDYVYFQGEVELRQDVKKLIDTRRTYRRSRRNRNTRYRKPRFLNRIKNKNNNWLSPSVASKCQHNINWIQRFINVLSNIDLHIEVGKFNLQIMKDPAITSIGYQQGDQYGYETVKQYVLARDNYTCQTCHHKGGKLKVHHIIYRSKGGTNRPDNLITVCSSCHTFQNHQSGGKKKHVTKNLKGATFMNILRRRLWTAFPNAHFQYGAWTTVQRKHLQLFKAHFNDAVAISGVKRIKTKPTSVIMFKQFRKKKRSLHEANPRKGRKMPNCRAIRNAKNTKAKKGFFLNDYVKFNNSKIKGYISGFTGSSAYIKNCLGKYLTITRYKQTVLSKLQLINHHNNWGSTEICVEQYIME